PKKVFYYTAASWKWRVYLMALEMASTGKLVQGNLIRKLMEDPSLKAKAREVAEFAGKVVEEVNRTPADRRQRLLKIGMMNEAKLLREAGEFLAAELDAEVHVYMEDDQAIYDPKNRAKLAKPLRPAIYIE
ncbi:MAG: leucine--tRNA ligase, partial [Candidatus Bathyarchaeia archaeon]